MSNYKQMKDELVIRFTTREITADEYRRLDDDLSNRMEDDLVCFVCFVYKWYEWRIISNVLYGWYYVWFVACCNIWMIIEYIYLSRAEVLNIFYCWLLLFTTYIL